MVIMEGKAMKKRSLTLLQLLALVCIFMTSKVYAFGCESISIGGSKTYTVSAFTAERDAINLTLPSSFISCSGSTSAGNNDALRVYKVTLNDKLINAGFTDTSLNISYFGDYSYPFSDSIYKCVWYDASCTTPGSSSAKNSATFKPTLKRAAGVWPALTMGSGETVLSIQLQQRGNYGSGPAWGGNMWTIKYVLNGPVTTPDYTCAINTYDNTVELPIAHASDIRALSNGKIPSSKTRFNIQLDCKKQTRVSLQFDGAKMSGTGTDDVLVNQISGNDNIGIQLYRADTETAIAFGSKYIAVDSANITENLAFDAYYYYNGGNISAGMLKSLATFTFTYE